jgi:hypothetical protein
MTMLLEDTGSLVREKDSSEAAILHPDRPLQKLKSLRDPAFHRSCVAMPRAKRFLVTNLDGSRAEWEHHGETQEDWCSKVRDL